MTLRCTVLACLIVELAAFPAQARTICTAIADAATGTVVLEQGDCRDRVTPASTFKIALSLIGYDSGLLKDAQSPALPFREGYSDWGGPEWKQTTDPTRWIQYSVVWYSQQLTQSLGAERFQDYVDKFHYGNQDLSGDPGKGNGLARSWLGSSLKISPLEQLSFLGKLVNRQLPVSAHAIDMTQEITRIAPLANGWDLHGKTGTGFPRTADGTQDPAHAYGWFVGWASKGARTFVFARLIQDEAEEATPSGPRARAALLSELPSLLEQL
jgi:beta-lactamase class D